MSAQWFHVGSHDAAPRFFDRFSDRHRLARRLIETAFPWPQTLGAGLRFTRTPSSRCSLDHRNIHSSPVIASLQITNSHAKGIRRLSGSLRVRQNLGSRDSSTSDKLTGKARIAHDCCFRKGLLMISRRDFVASLSSLPFMKFLGVPKVTAAVATASADAEDFTKHVKIAIGTGGHGHTYP